MSTQDIKKKFRYPGINHFTAKDRNIFKGRDDAARKLLNRILMNNTMVLHGESGAGKSSLVRAGLIPLLEELNEVRKKQGKPQYLPVPIGLDAVRRKKTVAPEAKAAGEAAAEADPQITPAAVKPAETDTGLLVNYVLECINEYAALRAEALPFIDRKPGDLWYTAKLFEKNNYTLLLLFDQFEELQGFTSAQVTSFTKKLAALFASSMPEEFCDEYNENTADADPAAMDAAAREAFNTDITFIEQPLSVRLLFALREDRLGTMSLLSDYFPDILKNDLFLKPLDEAGAIKAIAEPCLTAPAAEFLSPEFTIVPETVKAILESLKPRQKEAGFYEPIEIQIICSRLEKMVISKKMTRILPADLPPVENAVRDFYNEKWELVRQQFRLNSSNLLELKKHFIEKLVVNRKRNLALEDSLVRNDTDRETAGILAREGLLRLVPSGKDNFYQLCHDRFIEPMLVDSITIRSEEQAAAAAGKRRKVFAAYIIALLVLGAAALMYLFYRTGRKQEEEKMLNLVTTIKRAGNHTLSYVIGADWLRQHPGSKKMRAQVSTFDSVRNAYLTGIYPALTSISSAAIKDGLLTIREKGAASVWNMRTHTQLSRTTLQDDAPVKQLTTAASLHLNVISRNDSLLVKDSSGRLMAAVQADLSPGGEDVEVSPDGSLLFAGNSLYEMKTSGLLTRLPAYKKKKTGNTAAEIELTAYTFIDNNHYAAAYENGDILVGSINGQSRRNINVPDTLPNPYEFTQNNAENRITRLAVDKKGRYLFALNSIGGIDVYDKRKLRMQQSDSADKDNRLLKTLKGHAGTITSMDFSPDGQLLITGSSEGISILWDTESLEKISSLGVHNSGPVVYTAFSGSGTDIVTATEDDMVYTWKLAPPAELYAQERLYRFPSFNYELWYLKEEVNGKPRPTGNTSGLYHALLHKLANIPATVEFQDDAIFAAAIQHLFTSCREMYARLTAAPDFTTAVPLYSEALLNKLYYNALRQEAVLMNREEELSYLEKRKLAAGQEIATIQETLIDTTKKAGNIMLLYRHNSAFRYFERNGDYQSQAEWLRFYDDTILGPQKKRFGTSSTVKKLQRQADINWIRHYLLTGKPGEAENKARQLAAQQLTKTTNDSIYLVVTSLAANRYNEAAALYKAMQQTSSRMRMQNAERTARSLLKLLESKGINNAALAAFGKTFLNTTGKVDADD